MHRFLKASGEDESSSPEQTKSPHHLTATLSRSSARLSRWSLESRAAIPALLATQRESPTLATIRPRDRASNKTTSPVEPLESPSCSCTPSPVPKPIGALCRRCPGENVLRQF